MPFVPHTMEETQAMLQTADAATLEDLFAEIPAHLLEQENLRGLPQATDEMTLMQLARERAEKDAGYLCFAGAGAYEHHIPAAVPEIVSRGEFMTAYTPYQAEASQGTLQVLYEYQTMMARLMALDVSNASLYDGATALAEAILMAIRLCKKKSGQGLVLLPETLHPLYRAVVKTIVQGHTFDLIEVPFDVQKGKISCDLFAASVQKNQPNQALIVVIPQPNFFGLLEPADQLTDWAHAQGALVIGVVNPLAMALLKPPGLWGKKGVDIACGEGQPLGVPLASGGPYYGFLCCRKESVRQLPGRLVGRTQDKQGRDGYVLTLQAREQHIRRSRATSNICTSQGLVVTASTIYMSLLGAEGLRRVALACHQNTCRLRKMLAALRGVKSVFSAPVFHEFLLQLDQPVDSVLAELAAKKILGGVAMKKYYPQFKEALLVCVTETKTPAMLAALTEAFSAAMAAVAGKVTDV